MLPNKLIECRDLVRLILYVRVFDNETNAFVGHTANIHTEGMMLVSEKRIALDKNICLRLEHVKDDFNKIAISLFAIAEWHRDTYVSDVYNTGFRFVNTSHTQIIEILNLIEELTLDKTRR